MASITRNESGQVLIEYVLLVFLMLMMTAALGIGLRSTMRSLWKGYTNQIIAICPGCEPSNPVK